MEIGFYLLVAIIGVGFLLLAGFDIYRKSQIKLRSETKSLWSRTIGAAGENFVTAVL
ncbi:hypothetical protein [Planococcus soli]|uniref:hypothetical protein n=1 Tax=Planococcus soli TaxID=2666072 RepID=UPI00163DB9B6|nr:hypothetical protein [Planococcus soli]